MGGECPPLLQLFCVLTRSAQMAASLRLTSQAAQQPSRPPTHQDTALVLMIAYK